MDLAELHQSHTFIFLPKSKDYGTTRITTGPASFTGPRVKFSTRSTALRGNSVQQKVSNCQKNCFERDVRKHALAKQRLYPKGKGKATKVKETTDPTKSLSKSGCSCIYLLPQVTS